MPSAQRRWGVAAAALAAASAWEERAECPASGGATGCARGEYFWPQQKGDVNRTGWSPHAVVRDLQLAPTWVWEDSALDVIRCTPLIDDQRNIYLGTQAGKVYKFSPNGQVLWFYHSTHGNIPSVPSLMDGSVYINTAHGFVVSVDMETGLERWATRTSPSTGPDTACVFAFNGTIVSATRKLDSGNNDLIVAVNADGSFKWRFELTWATFNFQAASPGDGTIVFQDLCGGAYRLQLEDGRLLWESGVRDRQPWFFTTGAAVVGPNGVVYCASNHYFGGIIHAYRLGDGAPLWTRRVGLPVNQAVAYGVLAGSSRPSLVAGVGENPGYPIFWLLFGKLPQFLIEWVHHASVRMAGWPTWLWGTKILPAALVAMDAETGEARWWYTPPPFTRPSAEGDEALLLQRRANKAQWLAYSIEEICMPDSWSQAVIGGDGTVYVGHQDGKLYSVHDANGNGHIEESEVSTRYFGSAFQGSQAIAPGLLAVAPCGGGLYVWKT